MKMALFLLILLFLVTHISECLRITKVLVPSYVWAGDSPKLICNFELEEGDELEYIIWLKDGSEFARITPNKLRTYQVQTAKRDGVVLDDYDSNESSIVLKDVTILSTGKYQCKVSVLGGQPKIKETRARIMVVVQSPRKVQILTSKESYSVGDNLSATCLAYSSIPTAMISWKVNGVSISQPQHESGKLSTDIINEYLSGIQSRENVLGNSFSGYRKEIDSEHFLRETNSSLQLQFQVRNKYLENGIKLECHASFGIIYAPSSKYIPVSSFTGKGYKLDTYCWYTHFLLLLTLLFK